MDVITVVVYFGGTWVNEIYKGGEKQLLLLGKDERDFANFEAKIRTHIGGLNSFPSPYVVCCLVGSPVDECGCVKLNVTNDVELKFAFDSAVRKFYLIAHNPTAQEVLKSPLPIPNFNEKASIEQSEVGEHYNVEDIDGEEDDDSDCDAVSVNSLVDDGSEGYDSAFADVEPDPIFHPLFQDTHWCPPLTQSAPPRNLYASMSLFCDQGYKFQHQLPKDLVLASDSQTLHNVEGPFAMSFTNDQLEKRATFESKDSLLYAVGFYHLTNKFEFSVERSSKERFYVTCKYSDRCRFHMRVVCPTKNGFWRITHLKSPHTCEIDLRVHSHRTMCSSVVGAYFAPKLTLKGAILCPREMVHKLQTEFGFKITYGVAWVARNKAVQMIYGDSDQSFRLLPQYLHMVEKCNPGSVCMVQSDANNIFEYAFMVLSASILGWASSCRPVICVDATHLKGKYRGVMFVAASKDANEQIFPLAFAIGDKECDRSWTWFMTQLKNTFVQPNDLLIVSDAHISISKAVEVVYPGVTHGLCCYHIQKNLAKHGKHVIQAFQRAANCCRREDFSKNMDIILDMCLPAFERLKEIDHVRWANSHCLVRRYGVMTSNACENINSTLRWSRTLPVSTLMEAVRAKVGGWFVERREFALARQQELSPRVTYELEINIEYGFTLSVEPINLTAFCVKHSRKSYIVDLDARTCACRAFYLNLIHCSHASATISHAKQQTITYVSTLYSTKSLADIYAGDIYPIPNKDDWILPKDVKNREVKVPDNPRQAGSPKNKRIPSHVESSRSSSRCCSRYKQSGHNMKTCSVNLHMSVSSSMKTSIRKKKSCSICKSTDHTRPKCPFLAKAFP